jgi:hypothetical protein
MPVSELAAFASRHVFCRGQSGGSAGRAWTHPRRNRTPSGPSSRSPTPFAPCSARPLSGPQVQRCGTASSWRARGRGSRSRSPGGSGATWPGFELGHRLPADPLADEPAPSGGPLRRPPLDTKMPAPLKAPLRRSGNRWRPLPNRLSNIALTGQYLNRIEALAAATRHPLAP